MTTKLKVATKKEKLYKCTAPGRCGWQDFKHPFCTVYGTLCKCDAPCKHKKEVT